MVATMSGCWSHVPGDGGSAVAVRCHHHHQRARRRWQLTMLLLLVLRLCASRGLVSGAAEAHTEPAKRPLLLYIPMHVSEPLEHLQELCDRTLSKDPWVAAESNGERELNIQLAFDILLVVSGPSEAFRNTTERFDVMRSMLEAATETLLQSPPRIFTDFKAVGVDRYNLNLAEEDKDAEWVSGPNSVFYDAFAEGGEIYEKYVRFYALVQQLETDVCALRGGWLSALLRPMLVDEESASGSSLSLPSSSPPSSSSPFSSPSSSSNLVIISGSTIKSSCSYVVKYDECQPFEEEARFMTEHVNGNAVYRTGDLLQQVLKSAREQFANAEPFDLAIHHVLKASNASSTLAHSNPLYHNTATLLDRDWFLDVRYHGVDDLAVLHAPRRLRSEGIKAVATRAQAYFPATTVVLSEDSTDEQQSGGDTNVSSSTLLLNFKAAAADLHLSGVIYVALTEDLFIRASRVVPLQVLPAFERRRVGRLSNTREGDVDSSSHSSVASASTAAAEEEAASSAMAADAAPTAAETASSAAAAAVDPKSFILTWPPTAPSPATRLLATITQLVTQGYSPLVVDAASAPIQNYDVVLYGFPKDAVFFADKTPGFRDEVRRPFSVKTDDKARMNVDVETMYAPATAYTANLLQAWAVTTLQRQQLEERGDSTSTAAALLTIAEIKALAACRLGNMSGFTPCPWRGISVETLPIHLFPPQVAFFGSGWTRRARKHALFLDMSSSYGGGVDASVAPSPAPPFSSSSTTTIFRLRQVGKWHTRARCPTYSVLSRLPKDLTHETIFDELTLHAEFLSFVHDRKVACAVLPGFRVPSTDATLPVDALLDLETIHAFAGTQATILPRVQDVEDASRGYVAFERDRRSNRSSSQHSRKQEALPRDDLCSAFYRFARHSPSSPSACLARDMSLALNEARSALPSSYICAHDARSTVEEVALVGLRGASGLGEVAAEVLDEVLRDDAARAPSPDTTVLLAGAWRLLPRGSFGKVVDGSLASSLSTSSSTSSRAIITLSDLHSHDQKLQCAQELNPKASPLADEAWAGVLEALLCRHSVLSFDVSRQLLSHDLRKKTALRSKAGYRKSTTNNFAELVATHIPPSILLEDVTAFAKWLARPDRPNLVRGRSLQSLVGEGGGPDVSASAKASTVFSSSSQQHHRRHQAALQSLSMLAPTIAETRADYAFLPAAAEATTGKLLPWSSVTEISELYRVRPALLPPSLAAMMHPKAVLEFLLSPESSTLPLNVAEASRQNENAINDNHVSQDAAFRMTVAALGRMSRREAALRLRKKKLWVLQTAAAARHQQSRETLSISSMGAGDDVFVVLPLA